MKKIISVLIASMMMAMPVFSLADSAASATDVSAAADSTTASDAATSETDITASATAEPAALTAAGTPIFDMTAQTAIESGAALLFSEDNFQLTAPADWATQELTEEQLAAGTILNATDASGASVLSARRVASEAATLDELMLAVSGTEGYTDTQLVLFNGVPYVAYTDETTGTFGYCALDAANAGYIAFEFTAGEGAAETAAQVMSSLAAIDTTADCTIKTLEQLTAAESAVDGAETGSDAAVNGATDDDAAADSVDDTTSDDNADSGDAGDSASVG